MPVHFISDLHLDPDKPGIERILLDYLQTGAKEAEALYLLGDIFEYWLGDDVSLPRNQQVCDALATLSAAGTNLYFMRGNRDFMVGEDFTAYCGVAILNDPHVIQLQGEPALLSHGDLFCTDDVEHQTFRELVSQQSVRNRLLALPAAQREQMAAQLRGMSKSNMSGKSMDIMDVNPQTVEAKMREYGVCTLIHGHTHRCAMHEFELDGRPARRIVLSDWHEDRGNVLIAGDGEPRFESLFS